MKWEWLFDADRACLLAFNGSDSLFLDELIKVLTSGTTWLPLYVGLLLVVGRSHRHIRTFLPVVAAAVLCVLLTACVTNLLVKPWVCRLRPLNDPLLRPLLDTVAGIASSDFSFFSAHAANTAGIATFFSLLFRRRSMTLLLIGWSLLNCFTRLYLAMHYPSDVLVGLFFGMAVGTSVHVLYHRWAVRNGMLPSPRSNRHTPSGYDASSMKFAQGLFLLCIVYALCRSLPVL